MPKFFMRLFNVFVILCLLWDPSSEAIREPVAALQRPQQNLLSFQEQAFTGRLCWMPQLWHFFPSGRSQRAMRVRMLEAKKITIERLNLSKTLSMQDQDRLKTLKKRLIETLVDVDHHDVLWNSYYDHWLRNPRQNHVWIARDIKGGIQGYLWAEQSRGDITMIHDVVIHQAFEGMGLATRLAFSATQWLAQKPDIYWIKIIDVTMPLSGKHMGAIGHIVTRYFPEKWRYSRDPFEEEIYRFNASDRANESVVKSAA